MAKEYIEREALIRYAEKQRVVIKDGTSVAEAMRIQGNVFRRCVEVTPTADVEEVRHGGWLEQNLCGKTIYVCSNCQTLGSPLWKRCPVCEVKMGGKNE